jgi:GntR family transcriptional regulator
MRIRVEPKSNVPVFAQIMGEIRAAVARGACGPDMMLPSVRQLASDALVNPNTVAKAYRELEREGILYTKRGLGVFIAHKAPALCRTERARDLAHNLRALIASARRSGLTEKELRQAFGDAMKKSTPEEQQP